MPLVSLRSAYNAAKHALDSLTANLRMDVRAQYPEIFVSTVHPGMVATDFGLNALKGGPDSRSFPQAQTVEEVANILVDLIRHPCADVFTQPAYKHQVAHYFSAPDIGDVEREPPFMPAPRIQDPWIPGQPARTPTLAAVEAGTEDEPRIFANPHES